METAALENKLRELDEKYRIELAKVKVESMKLSYKSNMEQAERMRQDLKQYVKSLVQDELLHYRRETFALERQMSALKTHLDSQKWEEQRTHRTTMRALESLQSKLRELSEHINAVDQAQHEVQQIRKRNLY